MIVQDDNKTVKGVAIAALVGTAIWGVILIAVGMYFEWSAMVIWFLSLATILAIVFAAVMIMDALSKNDDDDNDEHEDFFIG